MHLSIIVYNSFHCWPTLLFTLGWHYLYVFLRTVASCSFLDSFFPLLVRWCKIAKVIYLHWSFSFPRTSLSAVVDYLSSVSIRASICSQNSSWHADFIVLAFVNQDFLIKNYFGFLFLCHLLQSYFCLSAGRGINTYRYSGTVACEREGEWWRSISKKTHNVVGITDVLVEKKKVLFVILRIWEFL